MRTSNCPSCGASINFINQASAYTVCTYCKSLITKDGVALDKIGKIAEPMPDMSPFQIGSSGVFDKNIFTIIGRQKLDWGQGYWNEWSLHTGKSNGCWLADAQGTYAISEEVENPPDFEAADIVIYKLLSAYGCLDEAKTGTLQHEFISKAKFLAPDLYNKIDLLKRNSKLNKHSHVTIKDKQYTVSDIKFARCVAAEGEISKKELIGQIYIVADCLGTSSSFASIEIGLGFNRTFVGHYYLWEDLKITNFRHFDGWKAP